MCRDVPSHIKIAIFIDAQDLPAELVFKVECIRQPRIFCNSEVVGEDRVTEELVCGRTYSPIARVEKHRSGGEGDADFVGLYGSSEASCAEVVRTSPVRPDNPVTIPFDATVTVLLVVVVAFVAMPRMLGEVTSGNVPTTAVAAKGALVTF